MKLLRSVAQVTSPRPRVSSSSIVPFGQRHAELWSQKFSRQKLWHAARVLGPALFALLFASVVHAQGTMDFSGAQTLMGTFNKRFAYVAVSRGSHDAHIYTDNASSLVSKLSHDVVKSSALQVGQQFPTDQSAGFQM